MSIRLLDSGLRPYGPFEPYQSCTFYPVVFRDGQMVPYGELQTVLWTSMSGNNISELEHSVFMGEPGAERSVYVWVQDVYGNTGADTYTYYIAQYSSNEPGINVHCLV